MYDCKICGKNLYNKITFVNIFKLNYNIHKNCIDKFKNNESNQMIPIDGNYVIYDHVLRNIPSNYNDEFIWFYFFSEVLIKQLSTQEWSMVVIYDNSIEKFIQHCNPYLLFNLTKSPILILSLVEKEMTFLEGL